MAKVFHLLTPEEKKIFIKNGLYQPKSLKEVGFIHLSKADQIDSIIKKFYQKCERLLIWRISENNLSDYLKYEPPLEAPNSGIKFPHYYSNLNMNHIEKEFTIQNINQQFKLPKDLLG